MLSQKLTVCLVLFVSVAIIVGAERIVIKDYQGPEEKVITDRVIKYLDVVSSGLRKYVAVGDPLTEKILYTLNPNFAEYVTKLKYTVEDADPDIPEMFGELLVKAKQHGNKKIEITKIVELHPFQSNLRPLILGPFN